MAYAKTRTVESASNLTAKALMETYAKRKSMLVIRLKSGKYASTNKPLNEHILYKVNQQIVSSGFFTYFFHGSVVIGLRYKYTAKRTDNKVQKVGEIVHFVIKLRRVTLEPPAYSPRLS